MPQATNIEWADAVWNPVRGCTRVSEGCRNCYAERVAARFSGPGQPYDGLVKRTAHGPRWTGNLAFIESALKAPHAWKKPRRIFVNSMSDLFHEKVGNDWIDRIFSVMALCPQHTFLVLTKRPERMREYFALRDPTKRIVMGDRWPLRNVWLGVSVEDQATANDRIPHLLATSAAVRFISYEPALGPVDFNDLRPVGAPQKGDPNPFTGRCVWPSARGYEDSTNATSGMTGRVHWIICGGESGPGARPMHPDWARSARDQCQAAGVPFFMKQMARKATIPDDLMVREFPEIIQ